MKRFVSVIAFLLMLSTPGHAELPAAAVSDVNQALSSGKPTLIDFGLLTCNVCKKMAPHLEALSTEYRGQANILFLDVRADQTTAKEFRIRMLPAQIFLNAQGQEVARHTGYMSKEELLGGLKSAGLK